MPANAVKITESFPARSTSYRQVTPKHCTRLDDALHEIDKRRQSIRSSAERVRRKGGIYRDQDHPLEILTLSAATPTAPPLLLIGGMGPLAGLVGFETACRRFHRNRSILLLQACDIPCRTTAISKSCAASPNRIDTRLINAISHALSQGVMMVEAHECEVILLCNTAHYFLPAAMQCFHNTPSADQRRLTIHSLISAAADEALKLGYRRVLVLATRGTCIAELYTEALRQRDIKPITPTQRAQTWLDKAIHDGIKAHNSELARHAWQTCLHALEINAEDIDGVIAGCTEIPLLLELTTSHTANDPTTDLLSKTGIIDPLDCLLKQLS